MNYPELQFSPAITGKLIVGVLEFSGLKCQPGNEELWFEIEKLQKKYTHLYSHPFAALSLLRPARDLYRAVGMEPTRIRPSSEALFRRVIKGKPLYQINSIVDACNYLSLSFLLPIGLYDLRKIEGNIHFRFGENGEEYEGIGKESVHVGGRLCLADNRGAFGNPSADSLRTAIDLHSEQVLMVIFAPFKYAEAQLQQHVKLSGDVILRYHPTGKLEKMQIMR